MATLEGSQHSLEPLGGDVLVAAINHLGLLGPVVCGADMDRRSDVDSVLY